MFLFVKQIVLKIGCNLIVFFNNNQIGNTLNHLWIESVQNHTTTFKFVYSNGTQAPGYRMSFWFNVDGTITNPSFTNQGTYSFNVSHVSNSFTTNSSFIDYKILFTYHLHNSIYYSSNWYFNSNNSIVEEVTPVEPDIPSGEDNTGTITNNSGETTGNIDLSGITSGLNRIEDKISTSGEIQNILSGETGRIIDNQNQNTENIIASITDTNTDVDISGELNGMINTDRITDPTTNFFSWLLDNLHDFFQSSGTYYLEFDFMTKHIKIGSDFFVLPDGDLKTFFQMAFMGWFGWAIIKKIRYIVYAVQCVKIKDALHQVDFNPNIL